MSRRESRAHSQTDPGTSCFQTNISQLSGFHAYSVHRPVGRTGFYQDSSSRSSGRQLVARGWAGVPEGLRSPAGFCAPIGWDLPGSGQIPTQHVSGSQERQAGKAGHLAWPRLGLTQCPVHCTPFLKSVTEPSSDPVGAPRSHRHVPTL